MLVVPAYFEHLDLFLLNHVNSSQLEKLKKVFICYCHEIYWVEAEVGPKNTIILEILR